MRYEYPKVIWAKYTQDTEALRILSQKGLEAKQKKKGFGTFLKELRTNKLIADAREMQRQAHEDICPVDDC